MQDKQFSIIVKDINNSMLIESLLKQSFTNWECFLPDTNNKIEQTISDDERFHIIKGNLDKYDFINNAVAKSSGQYVIVLNSDDFFIPHALDFIIQMIEPTNADIILYGATNTETIPDLPDNEYRCIFRYLVRKSVIMDNIFESLSSFCFKRTFLQNKKIYAPEELFIFNSLSNISAITKTKLFCLLQKKNHLDIAAIEYKLLIDNFIQHKNNFSKDFWKNYFYVLVPRILSASVYQHNNQSLLYCAEKVPLQYIPLKYKFMFLFLKTVRMK